MTGEPDGFTWPGTTATNLAGARVSLLGLGLMGGSLALALRGHCDSITAYDRDPVVGRLALERGIIDRWWNSPAEAARQADLLVLAAPVRGILAHLQALPGWTDRPLVVMDLGSTKKEIAAAMVGLPDRFVSIPGHPMCGKETGGILNAEAGLYRNAPFALISFSRTPPAAKALAEELVDAVGARPVWLTAETHDQMVAATSHLPYLLAAALALATPETSASMVGPGFRGAARLTGSDPGMMLDILATNRLPVLEAVSRFESALADIKLALAGDESRLPGMLQAAQTQYRVMTGAPWPPETAVGSQGRRM